MERMEPPYPGEEEEELGFLRLCPARDGAVQCWEGQGGSRAFSAEVKVLSPASAHPEWSEWEMGRGNKAITSLNVSPSASCGTARKMMVHSPPRQSSWLLLKAMTCLSMSSV